jgi:sec-independent protein translocase protein TatB
VFDVGFWELALIAIVALVVFGPERLPQLVRDLGRWAGALRRFAIRARYEIERELELDQHKDLYQKIADLDELREVAPDRERDRTP